MTTQLMRFSANAIFGRIFDAAASAARCAFDCGEAQDDWAAYGASSDSSRVWSSLLEQICISPSALRSGEMLCDRLFSSTAAPFQTSSKSSSLVTVCPARATSRRSVASGLGVRGMRDPARRSEFF